MEAILVRNKLHKLIDKVENVDLLERFYNSINDAVFTQKGIWTTLSANEKETILESLEGSKNEANLISHDKIKAKYSKWLAK